LRRRFFILIFLLAGLSALAVLVIALALLAIATGMTGNLSLLTFDLFSGEALENFHFWGGRLPVNLRLPH
jgi:hypothetical protein